MCEGRHDLMDGHDHAVLSTTRAQRWVVELARSCPDLTRIEGCVTRLVGGSHSPRPAVHVRGRGRADRMAVSRRAAACRPPTWAAPLIDRRGRDGLRRRGAAAVAQASSAASGLARSSATRLPSVAALSSATTLPGDRASSRARDRGEDASAPHEGVQVARVRDVVPQHRRRLLGPVEQMPGDCEMPCLEPVLHFVNLLFSCTPLAGRPRRASTWPLGNGVELSSLNPRGRPAPSERSTGLLRAHGARSPRDRAGSTAAAIAGSTSSATTTMSARAAASPVAPGWLAAAHPPSRV